MILDGRDRARSASMRARECFAPRRRVQRVDLSRHRHLLGIAELSTAETHADPRPGRDLRRDQRRGRSRRCRRCAARRSSTCSSRRRRARAPRSRSPPSASRPTPSTSPARPRRRPRARRCSTPRSNLQAMAPDVIVLRHSSSGAPHFIAKHVDAAVINAGDGTHEHPTQALLDCATIRKHKGKHRRAHRRHRRRHRPLARGALRHPGAHAARRAGCASPGRAPCCRSGIEDMGAEVFDRVEPAVADADVVMMLRIQHERLGRRRPVPQHARVQPLLRPRPAPGRDAQARRDRHASRARSTAASSSIRRSPTARAGHPRPGDLRRRGAHGASSTCAAAELASGAVADPEPDWDRAAGSAHVAGSAGAACGRRSRRW